MFKYESLLNYIKQYSSVLLGFSGGVDSTLLAKALKDASVEFMAVTVRSQFTMESEIQEAIDFCTQNNIQHKVIDFDVIKDENICKNSIERCYFCKKAVFSKLCEMGKDYAAIFDGTNHDDLGVFRPGRLALKELNVISPLAKVGFSKHEIRQASKELGLKTYNKPAYACLATRVPYDVVLTSELLFNIDRCEDYLHNKGFLDLRFRVHGDLARIEVPKENFHELLDRLNEDDYRFFEKFGFKHITLDLKGYRMGSWDEGKMHE